MQELKFEQVAIVSGGSDSEETPPAFEWGSGDWNCCPIFGVDVDIARGNIWAAWGAFTDWLTEANWEYWESEIEEMFPDWTPPQESGTP